MIRITEKKIGNEPLYKKEIIVNDKCIASSTVRVRAIVISRKERDYYMIYNSDMKVVSEAFNYINNVLSEKASNTQIKTLVALKFLYVFEELIGKKLEYFLAEDIISLKNFLHGYSPKGQEIELNLITTRSNETVNGYLSIYRGYLQYLNIVEHPLFKTLGKTYMPYNNNSFEDVRNAPYKFNDKKAHKFVEVPKYISVEEFERILDYVRKNCDLKTEIIIRLMYQCGLRIGEVLGLTADDLVMEDKNNLPSTSAYDEFQDRFIPIAYIRNRLSDSKGQQAKSCMKIVSKKQYFTEEYNLYNYGYQFVVVPIDLFDLINDYIEEAHLAARNNCHDRYYSKTIADRVREPELYEDDNYYIFINSIGTPLSIDSWNRQLRDIYENVGIVVDKDKRKSNLNHRFRHGYAMFQVIYCHTQEIKLADLLRHQGLGSVMCYYRPTITDQIKLKNAAIESMYEAIPTLKRSY